MSQGVPGVNWGGAGVAGSKAWMLQVSISLSLKVFATGTGGYSGVLTKHIAPSTSWFYRKLIENILTGWLVPFLVGKECSTRMMKVFIKTQ